MANEEVRRTPNLDVQYPEYVLEHAAQIMRMYEDIAQGGNPPWICMCDGVRERDDEPLVATCRACPLGPRRRQCSKERELGGLWKAIKRRNNNVPGDELEWSPYFISKQARKKAQAWREWLKEQGYYE